MITIVDLPNLTVRVLKPEGVRVCIKCKGSGTASVHIAGSLYHNGFSIWGTIDCPLCHGSPIIKPTP